MSKEERNVRLPGEFIENDLDATMAVMMKNYMNPGKDIDLLSEVPEDAIVPLVKVMTKAKIRRCDTIDYAVEAYLRLMVSKNRIGRKESTGIIEKIMMSIQDRVSGMRDMLREHQ